MKTKILTLVMSLFFMGSIFAQSHMVTYKFSIEGCNSLEKFELFRGIMFEGDEFIFENFTMPETETDLQFFYNLLVGSEFGIPNGSLKEDIELDITLVGLCQIDLNNLPNNNDLLNLLAFQIDVTGSESGFHSASDDYYYFENDSELYLRLKLDRIIPFLNFVSYSIDDLTPFYVSSVLGTDYSGIRKVLDENYCTIYATHFSTIGVGLKVDDPTGINTSDVTPNEFILNQNYPNPFNPSTVIDYTIPEEGFTKLVIYNAVGQEISTLISENQSAGSYSVNFNASNLSTGMYFYTLSSENFTQTNKMILMK